MAFDTGAVLVAAFVSAWNEFVAGVVIRAPFVLSVTMFVFAGTVCWSAAGASAGASLPDSLPLNTEMFPVRAGIEIKSAVSIKIIAAAMVSFDSTDAVPRGPNAALDTLLVNNAPASVLPGCSSTAATSTMQATKNIVYKTYSKF